MYLGTCTTNIPRLYVVSLLVLQALRWRHHIASSLLFNEALKQAFDYACIEGLLLDMAGTTGDSGMQSNGIDVFWTRLQRVKQQLYI